METSFFYNPAEKQLSFKLKERIKTASDIELKGNGLFNPSNGKFNYNGTLKKHFSSENAFGDTKIGAGILVDQKSKTSLEPAYPFLHASAEHRTPLNGPNTTFVVKGRCDYNIQDQELVGKRGSAYVRHRIPNLTASQDVQFKAGFDFVVEPGARNAVRRDLRLQARENNWALNYRTGRWTVTYDL